MSYTHAQINAANDRYNLALDSFLAKLEKAVPDARTRCGLAASLVHVVDSAKAYERECTTVEIDTKNRAAMCAHFGIQQVQGESNG